MKESDFIEQNKEKWKHFEQNLVKKDATPQEVSKLFVQITDDLSYSRTFYNNRSVKLYLNGIAKLLFNDINKAKKNKWSVFASFWKKELPQVMYASRRPMLISFLVFWSCFILGVITSIYEPSFANTILGDSYIVMTNENIESGSPMHVYADDGEMETFLPILLNNLLVAFRTFFSGFFASIGSLVIMMYNGVMVGVFQFFFVEKEVLTEMMANDGAIRGFFHYFFFDDNLFRKSFLSIWTHGTLEISAIIIAGGAGITLGKGLLFPKTYSRLQAFKMSARNGLKIIMGISPVIFLAAFIEGFLTRHTDIPNILRLSFILLSLAFIIVYFVWYPRWVAKKTAFVEDSLDVAPVYVKKNPFNPNKILSIAELFSESLRVYFKSLGFYLTFVLPCSLLFAIIVATDEIGLFFEADYYYVSYTIADYFNYSALPAVAIISGLFFLFFFVFSTLFTKLKLTAPEEKFSIKNTSFSYSALSFFLCTPVFVGLIAIGNGWFVFLAFLLLPLLILMSSVSSNENINFFAAAGKTSSLLNNNWFKFIALSLLISALLSLFFFSINAIFDSLIVKTGIIWSLTDDDEIANSLSLGFSAFLISFSFLSYLILMSASSCVLYYTLKETHTAKDLLVRIKNITAKE